MEMYFVTKVKFSNLLFYGLDINNTSEMVGACILTFLAAMMCESLSLLKTYLGLRMNENPLAEVQNPRQDSAIGSDAINSHDESMLLSSLRFPVSVRQIQSRRMGFHILSTLNTVFHVFWGYLIMLLVMTYSVWLTIAVVTGCGMGYYIFGAFKHTLELKYTLQQSTSDDGGASDENDQCHQPEESMHM